ncbi:MAG: ABC transporter permease [Ignavibacteria bacterium]|nr:ABC transporter permease [Ignavibacteria bacterium]
MNTVIKLIAKEYRIFWSDRVAVSLTFLIPILLIMLWGSIFGNANSGANNLKLAFLNNSTSPIAARIERVLDTTRTFKLIKSVKDDNGVEVKFDTSIIKDYVRKGSAAAALVIPADAFTDTSLGLKLKFYYDPKNDMEMQIIQGVLQQTIMTQIPSMFLDGMQRRAIKFLGGDSGRLFNNEIAKTVSKYFKIDPEEVIHPLVEKVDSFTSRATNDGPTIFNNILDIEKEQLVGKEVANPMATRSVGGWAMMFLLFTLSHSAASLFDEKKSGVVLRILASPISRVQILASKYLYSMSLGFIQLVVLFVGGALLFQIDIYSNFLNLVFIIIAAATACTAFGMLLAAISKTSAQANGLGTFLILAMSSVGGAWFPTSFMPEFIQTMSKGTIVYWSMDGFLKVLWRNAGTIDLLPNVSILFGIAILITSISILQFKKGHVF